MTTASLYSPWCHPPCWQRGRRRIKLITASYNTQAAQHTPLQRLPPLSFSYEGHRINPVELADLLQQVACFAPSQSFHVHPGGGRTVAIDPRRLRGALQRSLVCVAAYAAEQHLPPGQRLASRGLAPPPPRQQATAGWGALAGWQAPQRRVLVGFARAVGDAALVATVHDLAVMPELQRLGLGRQLLARLLRQLDAGGIVDVGLLAPDSSHGFFQACSFGPDTEGSTPMLLTGCGAEQRAGPAAAGMRLQMKQAAPH